MFTRITKIKVKNMYDSVINFVQKNFNMLIQLAIHSIVLIVGLKFINEIARNIKEKIIADSNTSTKIHLLFVISRIIKVLFVILTIASFLQVNGYSLTSLMTGLGITGLAIGFAAKESLACILGSFSIMLDNIYKIGDYVEINGYEGVVESINFRSTKLRTANNALITIPNNIPADTIVQNRSNAKHFRILQNFDIEYDTSDEKINLAMALIKQACENNKKLQKGVHIFISNLGENSITIQLIANTTTNDWLKYLKLKSELLQEVIHLFRANDINFAFPSRTVYVKNED